MELEGEARDEEISRAIAASRTLADASTSVQFDQFKTDLELDQVFLKTVCQALVSCPIHVCLVVL